MSELVPLIDRDMYTRFEAARSEIEVAGTGHVSRVFVPVGVAPTSAPSTFPRVLFVGKATRDWGDEPFASFDGSKGGAEDVIRYWLPTGRRSAFWQFARQILCQTLQQCEIPFSENGLPSFCGWSNLAKIGDLVGNPPPKSLEIQKALCIEALRSEIAFFKPTAVVAVTGDYAQHKIMEPVFGDDDSWHFDTLEEDRVAYQFHDGLKTLVIWTNHPQGMRPPGTRASVQEFATELIVRAMRGLPLPPGAIEPRP